MTNFNFRGWLKSLIVAGTLHGIIPIKLAYWLIQRGGLTHD
jgi:hypothetical protein